MVHENKKQKHDDKNQGNMLPSPLRLTTGNTGTKYKHQICIELNYQQRV